MKNGVKNHEKNMRKMGPKIMKKHEKNGSLKNDKKHGKNMRKTGQKT